MTSLVLAKPRASILMFAFRRTLGAVVLACGLALGCSEPEAVFVPTLEPLERAEEVVPPTPVDIRTAQAMDLRRLREEHSALIASIPTATPFPTLAPAGVVSGYLLDNVPLPTAEPLVTEPRLGVWWYRHAGGDWTTNRLRDLNPYYPLFYDVHVDRRYATFHNEGLQNEISRLLVDDVVVQLPEIADRASSLIAPLGDRLGWEFVNAEVPVVRVWSRFTYAGPDSLTPIELRVGGVLAFTVADHRDAQTGDVVYQYPLIAGWLGPVLLEESVPAER